MTIKKHRWTEGDDLVALYLFRHGDKGLPMKLASLTDVLGMSEASMIMRKGNFAALDREGGLSNAAKQTKVIYERQRKTSEAELRGLVQAHLSSKQ
jgi:hypothetical protein